MKEKRKRYTQEFKDDAVRLVVIEGLSVPKIAKDLGVCAEMVYLENVFETREKGQVKILKYINWYNYERLHSTIGYVSPNDFETGNVTKVVA